MCVLTVLKPLLTFHSLLKVYAVKPLLTFHSLLESIRCETSVNLPQFIGKYTL